MVAKEGLIHGIYVDTEKKTIYVDLDQPQIFKVIALNESATKLKEYIFKVSPNGVCLV